MPDQDAAENKAYEAANAISQQVGALWMSAHRDGMRNGMEAAALMIQAGIDSLKDNYGLGAEIRAYTAELLGCVRDTIRLQALQLPEPESTKAFGGKESLSTDNLADLLVETLGLSEERRVVTPHGTSRDVRPGEVLGDRLRALGWRISTRYVTGWEAADG